MAQINFPRVCARFGYDSVSYVGRNRELGVTRFCPFPELQAVSDLYAIQIVVYSSKSDEILTFGMGPVVIKVSMFDDRHFDAIEPIPEDFVVPVPRHPSS